MTDVSWSEFLRVTRLDGQVVRLRPTTSVVQVLDEDGAELTHHALGESKLAEDGTLHVGPFRYRVAEADRPAAREFAAQVQARQTHRRRGSTGSATNGAHRTGFEAVAVIMVVAGLGVAWLAATVIEPSTVVELDGRGEIAGWQTIDPSGAVFVTVLGAFALLAVLMLVFGTLRRAQLVLEDRVRHLERAG